MAKRQLRIAVDIGGTFTDVVLLKDSAVIATTKVLTTPDDPSRAVATGVEEILSRESPQNVAEIVHGTTLISNSLIERKGVVTGLITTAGFRDVVASGREQRYDLYDLFLEMPDPLVPRRRRWGVRERVLADGSVDTPLDLEHLEEIAEEVRESGAESIAICFLHSYRNPEHEETARERLNQLLPGVAITISSEVSPEIGEYHRTSTTVANAYVLPVVDSYLGALEEWMSAKGLDCPLRIMLSTGGLAATSVARSFPVRLLESGPAAGVICAGYVAEADSGRPVMAFDMGGTTAKAALIEGGDPLIAREFETARVYRFTKGSGLPIRVPAIDMIEIGAGGGSIARVGPFGLPKVGPDSASSDPGPVCYDQGGIAPTVTDADLILGYLDPGYFLGGEMRLAIEPAREALASVGELMGLSAEEAAGAVHQVVNENMASAARMHAIERGRDIRKYVLVATGGAGPVHAWGVAKALGITRIVLPPRAGVASAFGMLTAPTSFEFARSIPGLLANVDWDEVGEALSVMLETGRRQLAESNVDPTEVVIAADVRYQGQGDSLPVRLGAELRPDPEAHVSSRFEEDYLELYGSKPSDVEPEVLTWRLRISGPTPLPDIAAPSGDSDSLRGSRMMWFPGAGFTEGKVYDRYSLGPGFTIDGPAVVEERESTLVVGPSSRATVNERGNLELEISD